MNQYCKLHLSPPGLFSTLSSSAEVTGRLLAMCPIFGEVVNWEIDALGTCSDVRQIASLLRARATETLCAIATHETAKANVNMEQPEWRKVRSVSIQKPHHETHTLPRQVAIMLHHNVECAPSILRWHMKIKLTALRKRMARDLLYLTIRARNSMAIPLPRVSQVVCLSYGVDMASPLDSVTFLLAKAGMTCSQRYTLGSQQPQSSSSMTLPAHLVPTLCCERRSISRTLFFLMIASMPSLTQDAHQQPTSTLHANIILSCIVSSSIAKSRNRMIRRITKSFSYIGEKRAILLIHAFLSTLNLVLRCEMLDVTVKH
jgi:hypothetical protein